MIYRLAKGVQVRKEDWGLLFYSQGESRIYFVQSGDWLSPLYSDGAFRLDSSRCNEVKHTGASTKVIENSVHKLITYLVERGIVANQP